MSCWLQCYTFHFLTFPLVPLNSSRFKKRKSQVLLSKNYGCRTGMRWLVWSNSSTMCQKHYAKNTWIWESAADITQAQVLATVSGFTCRNDGIALHRAVGMKNATSSQSAAIRNLERWKLAVPETQIWACVNPSHDKMANRVSLCDHVTQIEVLFCHQILRTWLRCSVVTLVTRL